MKCADIDAEKYKIKLDLLLSNVKMETALNTKCAQIDHMLTHAAEDSHTNINNEGASCVRKKLYELMEARKRLNNG